MQQDGSLPISKSDVNTFAWEVVPRQCFLITSGVPQGSVLMLFPLFINDLSLKIGTATVDIHADDTTLTAACDSSRSSELSSTRPRVELLIGQQIINQSKTKTVLFASKRLRSKLQSHDEELNISLPGSDTPLSQVKSQKLPGVVLDTLSLCPRKCQRESGF